MSFPQTLLVRGDYRKSRRFVRKTGIFRQTQRIWTKLLENHGMSRGMAGFRWRRQDPTDGVRAAEAYLHIL